MTHVFRLRKENLTEDPAKARELYRLGKKYQVIPAMASAVTSLTYCSKLTAAQRFAIAAQDGISTLMWKEFYFLALKPVTSYTADDFATLPVAYLVLLMAVKNAAAQAVRQHLLSEPPKCSVAVDCPTGPACVLAWRRVWTEDVVPLLWREFSPAFDVTDALDAFGSRFGIRGMCKDCYMSTIDKRERHMNVYEEAVKWEMWRRCAPADMGFGEAPTWLLRWRVSATSSFVANYALHLSNYDSN